MYFIFSTGHCQSLPHNLGYRAHLCARCESALHVYLYSRKLSLPYLSFSSISHPSMGRRSGRSVPLSNNYFKLLTSQPYLSSLGRIGFPSWKGPATQTNWATRIAMNISTRRKGGERLLAATAEFPDSAKIAHSSENSRDSLSIHPRLLRIGSL